MTRKRNSTLKLMASIALVIVFCLSMALPSLAAPTDPAVPTSEAAITKLLQVPFGTSIPQTLSYDFVVTSVKEDDAAPTANMPVIGTELTATTGKVTIKFDGGQTLDSTVGDTTTWYRESPNLFADVNWPHAGVYEYKITETENTYTVNPTPPPTEVLGYSKAEYNVKVYVDLVNGKLEITHIGVLNIKDDQGENVDEEEQEKLDPTPGGGTKPGGGQYNYSQMIFVNTYVKTNGGTNPEEPGDWTLSISKAVAGDFSDPLIYFTFNLNLTAPSLIKGTPSYKAYVVEADSANPGKYKVVTSADNYAGYSTADGSITFTSESALTFNLKHGQYLVFIDTPVGTSYTVSETGTTGYLATASVVYNGTRGDKEEGISKGEGLVLPHASNTFYKDTLFVGEAANSADFINDRGTTTPTGISVENLPYIVLIGLALAGLTGFAAVKIRKGKRTQA